MKSRASLGGHPLHPMLVPLPIALLGAAALLDLLAWTTSNNRWFEVAGVLLPLGLGGALLAAVPGFVDYVGTVPPRSSASRRATFHMAINLSAIAVFGTAWWWRAPTPTTAAVPVALELAGLVGLAVGGWLGGTLVYRNQIGVDHRYARGGKWREEYLSTGQGRAATVALAEELDIDQMKLLHVNGARVVLARTARGYVAFDDRCPHRGGSLADGTLVEGRVQCPWHGSQFDVVSGMLVAGPAACGIGTYAVSVEQGEVRLVIERQPEPVRRAG